LFAVFVPLSFLGQKKKRKRKVG